MSDERVQALLRELERELAGTGRTVLDVARAYEAPRRRGRVGPMTGLPVQQLRGAPGPVYELLEPLALEGATFTGIPDPDGLGRTVVVIPGGGLVAPPRGFPIELVAPPRGTRARLAGNVRRLRRQLEAARRELGHLRSRIIPANAGTGHATYEAPRRRRRPR